jgi:hypothetical protein
MILENYPICSFFPFATIKYDRSASRLDWCVLFAINGIYFQGHTTSVKPSFKSWDELRYEALNRDGFRCRTYGSTANLEVHHTIPKYKGGREMN